MPRKQRFYEIRCPGCGEIRLSLIKTVARRCGPCFDVLQKERRFNTKCRRATSPSCMNCGDDADREYFMEPPHKDNKPRRWCPLCKPCVDVWLETGSHREVIAKEEPSFGGRDRPRTQDEIEAIRAGKMGTLDSSTGLLTWDWRRG